MQEIGVVEEEDGLDEFWIERGWRDGMLGKNGTSVIFLVHFVFIAAESGIFEELELLLN
jgi:hypothetical protein